MFTKTIDNKPIIQDDKGNNIVDLTRSIFNYNAGNINTYNVVKMTQHYEMRPDMVSYYQYGTIDNTEYILKYTGISNPFSLAEDDILMIPDAQEADTRTQGIQNNTNSETVSEAQVRNYFKFVNKGYKQDTTAYENVKNKKIPSAVKTDTLAGDFIVPYISEDGTAAVTIKNGRMYFGADTGYAVSDVIKASTTNIDEKIQSIIDNTATAMSDTNCMFNGTSLANFVRTNVQNNFANKNVVPQTIADTNNN